MTSTRTLRTRLGIAVRATLAGVILAACGGGGDSDKASASAWVQDVCTGLTGWLQELQRESTGLQQSVGATPGDLNSAKADLVEFMTNAVGSTDEMIDEVQAAGAPDVDKGDEIQSGLEDGLDEIRQAFADAKTQAEGLSVDDPAAFAQGAEELSASLQEAGEKAEGSLNDLGERYDAPSLDKAFEDEPACQQLEDA